MASCHVAAKVVKKRTLSRSAPENTVVLLCLLQTEKTQSLIEYGEIGIKSTRNMTNYEWLFLYYGSNTPTINKLLIRISGFLFSFFPGIMVFYAL